MGYCLASGRAAGHWAAALLRQAWAHPTGVHPGRPSSAWRASIPTPQMARIPDPAGPGGPQGRPDAGPQARRTKLEMIFRLLGEEFRRVRVALNDLTTTLLHLHETPSILIRPSGPL